jgi:hypothetical protein
MKNKEPLKKRLEKAKDFVKPNEDVNKNEIQQIPHNRKPYKKPENKVIVQAFLNCLNIKSDVANELGVDRTTVNEWLKNDPVLAEQVADAVEHAKDYVEGQLLKRIKGYDIEEVKVFQFMGNPVLVPVNKHYPPDVPAISKWLDAHAKDRGYFTKNVTELSGGFTIENSVKNLTDEEIERLTQELENK